MANTVSPSNNQIGTGYSFTTPKLRKLFGLTFEASMPCPTMLMLELVAINQLRSETAAGASAERIARKVGSILGRIDKFAPENWVEESYTLPDEPEVPLLGRLFKDSVAGVHGSVTLALPGRWLCLGLLFITGQWLYDL